MKNSLGDLNNHLFAQLERLGEEDLKGEKLQEEINRAKAISDIATQVIANGSLVLKAKVYASDRYNVDEKLPAMLEGEKCTDLPQSKKGTSKKMFTGEEMKN